MSISFLNLVEYYRSHAEDSSLSGLSTASLDPIKEWLRNELKLGNGKDNKKSATIRQQGNLFYKQKNLIKSVESYNFSMCCAQYSAEEFFLALANRSAATYELGRFEDCLKDIELCLSSSTYPKNLRPKLHSRKAACLKHLGGYHEMKKSKDETLPSSSSDTNSKAKENVYKLPIFEDGENPHFANASSEIDLRYNSQKGRHVVAKQHIPKGNILFIEKAFAFGSIFDENSKRMNMMKCYQCLKNTYSGIPCRNCNKCIFCDTKCRNQSWEESHRWECQGMIGDIWYHLGIALPAFRALLKGITSNFKEIIITDVNCFGNKGDNYPFFNSLVYDDNNKHIEVSIMARIVSTYLKEYTKYFDWLLAQTNHASEIEGLVKFFELHLRKHILQFQNNSSIIEHWIEDELLPLEKESVACGIFPSVSMMNHSCKPNITNYFVGDTIVVSALVDIKENEEICNCYGIYYRDMSKSERQEACSLLYNFECKCEICSDPSKEMSIFDSFICPNCGFDIPKFNDDTLKFSCQNCHMDLDVRILTSMHQDIVLSEGENEIQSLHDALDLKRKVLNRYHKDMQNTYFELYCFYKEKECLDHMLEYFEEWLRVEKIKIGQDIQLFGVLLHEVGCIIKRKMFSNEHTTLMEYKKLIMKAQGMIREAVRICKLYYPSHIIHEMLIAHKPLFDINES